MIKSMIFIGMVTLIKKLIDVSAIGISSNRSFVILIKFVVSSFFFFLGSGCFFVTSGIVECVVLVVTVFLVFVIVIGAFMSATIVMIKIRIVMFMPIIISGVGI